MKLTKTILGLTGVAALTAGATAATAILGFGAQAYANTPSFTLTCPDIPVAGTVPFTATLVGTATPSIASKGSTISLNGLTLDVTVPKNLVELGVQFKLKTLPLSFVIPVTTTNGSPSTIDETFSGDLAIPATPAPVSISLPASPSTATTTATTPGTLAFSVPTTGVQFTVENTIKSSCTVPQAETIASTTVTSPSSTTPPSSSSTPSPTRLVTGPPQAPGSSPLLPIGVGVASLGVTTLIALEVKRVKAKADAGSNS
ncbi:hypothetical protein [Ferrimicrobium sp.]|uniref:hypothetical protein n=1 Tax=Ferrimicrobium sp. TaxID=2926050 RepID=UPI0026184159|nr:hypothetical protein [Ferrimicrobium sp.]